MNKDVSITPKQYDFIADIQRKTLEKLAANDPVADILNSLCLLAESILPNAVASIMMLDASGGLLSVRCAPSIPTVGHEALAKLKPGPFGGSCGNAVFHNEAQYVQNTLEDERWKNLRHIAYDFNICSCWSMPVSNEHKQAIGSFALSSFEHRTPALFHKKILETCSSIVSIVLKRQLNEDRLLLLSVGFKNASEAVVITDKNNNIVEVNPAFEKIYGLCESDVLGKDPKILSSGEQGHTFYQQLWQELLLKDQWRGEITNKNQNGELVAQWMSISVIRDEHGEIQNYLSVFSDLTKLKSAQQQVVEMAFYDSVTQLHNKTYLEQQILANEQNYSLLLLNINNFSYLNTAYGFNIGDKILTAIANTLVNTFTTHETFRLNSDEFGLLFEGEINVAEQIKIIQQYFYNTLIQVEDISLHIAFTYGAAQGKKHLLHNCAIALKKAKSLGKNRYHIFDVKDDLVDDSTREGFIASNHLLYSALELDQFTPYFQGIYDNENQTIQKFEVLARIIKGDKVISPFHFLDTAKLSGLLPEITRIIVDKSFKIMSDYDYIFSINITEDDLSQNYLLDYLEEKTGQYKIQPQRVILEILEGVSATGKKNHINQLNELKAKGYLLAIDDFGTEYSNFERILELDIDYLKIDAKYIKDIDLNEKSYEITRAITFFAHNANIPCVAEFVHSKPVQTVVTALGINYSQGYYFSKPSPLPIIT
ncbi:sensor domain-containing diguanylate cyclase [Candidatus Colwellia aromaticivorans]|uniref:sensor domain-containing diguanylate cyclase n=1 Tax=Candidatus Colwellia aromaticivorans TaxID=2267621 RepID=UPI000DF21205|nr:EAL domain-containing protein [Candidatus Colwellia aromaticivorans]